MNCFQTHDDNDVDGRVEPERVTFRSSGIKFSQIYEMILPGWEKSSRLDYYRKTKNDHYRKTTNMITTGKPQYDHYRKTAIWSLQENRYLNTIGKPSYDSYRKSF